MICRNYGQGEKLQVGDLNEITVMIDRSETRLTEVAMNVWRRGLDGPPHSHGAKEQVFFITEGDGTIDFGKESHPVKPGSLVYIPAGVVHQSITGNYSLTYFLFNAFLDAHKEGHASFRDHIEKVKSIRQQQADTGSAASDPNLSKTVSIKKPRAVPDARGTTSAMLITHADTEGCEVERVGMEKYTIRAARLEGREQTLFVLSGGGALTVSGEKCDLGPGVVAFVPANAAQSIQAGDDGLTYLIFSTFMLA